MSSVHFDPSFWQHVHHTRDVEFSMLFSCVSILESVLGDKQEAMFGV